MVLSFKVDVREVNQKVVSHSLKKSGVKDHPQLTFDLFDLARAHARASLTYKPPTILLLLETYLAFQRYWGFFFGQFRGRFPWHRFYRDFSQTGHVGELAQAISIIFASKQTGSPWFADVRGFVEAECPTVAHHLSSKAWRKSGDYLFGNPKAGLLTVVESKGSAARDRLKPGTIATKLREAHKQCARTRNFFQTYVVPNFVVNKSFACYLPLDEETGRPGRFHFLDPEDQERAPKEWLEAIARYHLAEWFALSGRFDLAKQISGRQQLTLDINQEGIRNDLIPIGTATTKVVGEDGRSYPEGISTYIHRAVVQAPDQLMVFEERDPIYRDDEIVKVFTDGTALGFTSRWNHP